MKYTLLNTFKNEYSTVNIQEWIKRNLYHGKI